MKQEQYRKMLDDIITLFAGTANNAVKIALESILETGGIEIEEPSDIEALAVCRECGDRQPTILVKVYYWYGSQAKECWLCPKCLTRCLNPYVDERMEHIKKKI